LSSIEDNSEPIDLFAMVVHCQIIKCHNCLRQYHSLLARWR